MATPSAGYTFYPVIFLVYAVALVYDWIYLEIGHEGYGGKFKYLTFWNLCLQTAYFGLCVINLYSGSDIPASRSPKQRSSLQTFRDLLHSTLAFPVGMFVVVTFWGIFFLNRDMIYPESRAKLIPPMLHHVCHTTVLPLLLVDKYLVYHHHPRRHNGIFILTSFALAYLAWILWIAFVADLWVYPVLRVMENHERAIFILFLLMFFISIYLVGEALTKFLWRKEKAQLTAAVKKRK